MGLNRRSRWALAATMVLLGGSAATSAAAQTEMEADPVMAAFVHRFAQFVEWPEAAFAERGELVICVAGSAQFLERLGEVVAGNELSGLPVVARAVRSPAEVAACHVLFVSFRAARPDRFIEATEGLPVLTVGDSTDFLDAGGMIHLRIIDRRIRFAIDAAAAIQRGLRLSSQLLDLAVEVRGAGE
jgi:hypothetical protein